MARSTHLGDLEELTLLAALRLGPDAHGGAVRDELKREAGRPVSVSTVYVTLMRLEEKGYVRSELGRPEAVRGGKARRLFAVSPEGVAALEAQRDVRAHLWKGVDLEGDARV